MTFHRRKRSDPSLIPLREGSDSVRAQVGLLAEEVHLQVAELERALKGEIYLSVADSEAPRSETRAAVQTRG